MNYPTIYLSVNNKKCLVINRSPINCDTKLRISHGNWIRGKVSIQTIIVETILTQTSIIETTKQALNRAVKEREELSMKLNSIQQVRDEQELNFEGILRSYK